MSKKLLLADDSITIQKVIGITFANEDYELVAVDNGDAALQKAQVNRPDLILADVYMPGKNGYELCAAVKSDATLQGVPVLLLAGTFEPFDEEKARTSGADDWISKPFESQALIDKVETLLSRPATAAPAAAPAAAAPAPVVPAPEAVPPAAPAVAPVAPVVEPAAAAADTGGDIWDDMAADDIFAEEEPATEVPAQQADDDLWGALEEEELVEEPAVSTSGSDEDDLWGALDEEMAEPAIAVADDDFDFAEEPADEPQPAPATPVAAAVTSSPEEDILSLDEDDILAAEDIELIEDPSEVGAADFEFDDNTFGEEIHEPGQVDMAAVSEQPPVASTGDELDWGDLAEPSEMAEMYDSFEEELAPPAMPAAPEPALAPEPSAPVAPAPVPEPVTTPAPAAPAAPAAAPVDSGQIEQAVAAISEEQLNAIVEKVAASMLEKIAWEVVPDLAENLIKEELRKIREEAG